jgi:CubicO group peptidase (beta-lactamase class C family)
MSVDAARLVVEEAIRQRGFPAATLDVGGSDGAIWRDALGTLTFDRDAAAADIDTPFDLASLTKVIATTTVVMRLVAEKRLDLDEPVRGSIDEWQADDRRIVTIRDLLEHASGLPARLVDRPPGSRREFEHEISAIRLEHPPRERSVYSDLGFILLGFIAADRGSDSLARLFDATRAPISPRVTGDLSFSLGIDERRRAAPTLPLEDDARRGRTLVGEVHDSYAAALGGVAGHAGLFGAAPAVGAFARAVLRAARGDRRAASPLTRENVALFTRRSLVPGSSRALGWDTMLTSSSCGTRMTSEAFGHVGFTGTSLWIDPPRDRYYVLLTNRVCGGGTVDEMRAVRRAFHDALADV